MQQQVCRNALSRHCGLPAPWTLSGESGRHLRGSGTEPALGTDPQAQPCGVGPGLGQLPSLFCSRAAAAPPACWSLNARCTCFPPGDSALLHGCPTHLEPPTQDLCPVLGGASPQPARTPGLSGDGCGPRQLPENPSSPSCSPGLPRGPPHPAGVHGGRRPATLVCPQAQLSDAGATSACRRLSGRRPIHRSEAQPTELAVRSGTGAALLFSSPFFALRDRLPGPCPQTAVSVPCPSPQGPEHFWGQPPRLPVTSAPARQGLRTRDPGRWSWCGASALPEPARRDPGTECDGCPRESGQPARLREGLPGHRGADWREPAWQQPQRRSRLGWGWGGEGRRSLAARCTALIGSGRKAGAGSRARWQWEVISDHQMWPN